MRRSQEHGGIATSRGPSANTASFPAAITTALGSDSTKHCPGPSTISRRSPYWVSQIRPERQRTSRPTACIKISDARGASRLHANSPFSSMIASMRRRSP